MEFVFIGALVAIVIGIIVSNIAVVQQSYA